MGNHPQNERITEVVRFFVDVYIVGKIYQTPPFIFNSSDTKKRNHNIKMNLIFLFKLTPKNDSGYKKIIIFLDSKYLSVVT